MNVRKHPIAAGALTLAVTLALAGAAAAGDPKATEPSPSAEVGKAAPGFTLTDTEGKTHSLADYTGKGNVVVLEWFNPDCPFVQKHHKNHKSMAETRAAYAEKNVVWLAVNSAAPGKQGAGVDRNRQAIKDYGIVYPVLLDESGAVGKAYGARTTPQIYVIDPKGTILFNGPLDDVADPSTVGKTNYVREVLDLCVAGKPVDPKQVKSYGCSVKYAS